MNAATAADAQRPVLITGGAGFIGTNVADRLLRAGTPVIALDNLSRAGADANLGWLRQRHGALLQFVRADVRDAAAVRSAVEGAGAVIHLAAQVAVTTSIEDPVHDFDVNAGGTLQLLAALRRLDDPPPLLFTSTNKVYGNLGDIALAADGNRYVPLDSRIRRHGVSEDRGLDFQSPYGCSKGAADQYVIDYARTFGLRTVVFRMSCIYGPHQWGTADQGWVAHFLLSALRGLPITVYGDGRQVRDVLHVDDLADAITSALAGIDRVAGRAFNIGGGVANTTSLIELIEHISEHSGVLPMLRFDDWRPGDQRYYVSDTRAFTALTGWNPRVGVSEGVRRLVSWITSTRDAGTPALPAAVPVAAPRRAAALVGES
jgi:CDP-paratose 2-epimerase